MKPGVLNQVPTVCFRTGSDKALVVFFVNPKVHGHRVRTLVGPWQLLNPAVSIILMAGHIPKHASALLLLHGKQPQQPGAMLELPASGLR